MDRVFFVTSAQQKDLPNKTWKEEHQEKIDKLDQRIGLLRNEITELERQKEIVWERMCLPPPGLAGIQ